MQKTFFNYVLIVFYLIVINGKEVKFLCKSLNYSRKYKFNLIFSLILLAIILYYFCSCDYTSCYTDYINDIMNHRDYNHLNDNIVSLDKNIYFNAFFTNESIYVPSYFVNSNIIDNNYMINSDLSMQKDLTLGLNTSDPMSNYNIKLNLYYKSRLVYELQEIVNILSKYL